MLGQYFLILEFFCVGFLLFVLFKLRCFAVMDKQEENRQSNLDGFRFFLAFLVVCHHVVPSYYYALGHGWSIADYKNYQTIYKMGDFAVDIFFMISAYLFLNVKLGDIRAIISFYIKRFFRIFPVFFLSSSFCLITLRLFGGKFQKHHLFSNIIEWFNAGLTIYKPDINNIRPAFVVNAGVTWTLHFEWLLYFSLPIIFLIKRCLPRKIFLGILIVSSLSLFFYCISFNDFYTPRLLCFLCGFLVVSFKDLYSISNKVKDIFIIACIVIQFIFIPMSSIYAVIPEMIVMVCVCNGADLWGLLTAKPIVRLGEITYSLYMLHGICLFYLNEINIYFQLNYISYNILLIVFVVLSVFISFLSYVFFETKGIIIGRNLAKKMKEFNT